MKIADIRPTLHEDAESDAAMYSRANAIVKAVARYTWDHDDPKNGFGLQPIQINFSTNQKFGGTMYMVTPTMVPGLPKDLVIAAGMKGEGSDGAMIHVPALAQHFPGVEYMVIVYCLTSDSAEQARTRLSGSLRVHQILLHELTHYFDEKEKGLIDKNTGYSTNTVYPNKDAKNKAYFNDGKEINAYFHEIAERFTTLIHDLRKDPEEGLMIAELLGFSEDFPTALKGALSHARSYDGNIKPFLQFLKAPRYKRMVGRLYKLHQLAVQLMNQASAKQKEAA